MGVTTRRSVVSVSLNDLESLIRRVIPEELARQRQQHILDDWSHGGPGDPVGDEDLLRDAQAASEGYRVNREGWLTWEEFEAEIGRAEAAGAMSQEVQPPV